MKLPRQPEWTPEFVERFRARWKREQAAVVRAIAREMRIKPGAATAAYYRFIVHGEEPKPRGPLKRGQRGRFVSRHRDSHAPQSAAQTPN